jgi:cell division transport system ATP-binding protein
MINFEDVTKTYGEDMIALDSLNFGIKQGEFISIVGRSGAGKSTLLRLITREDQPTSGRVYIENVDISKIKPKHLYLLRRKIGVVYQDMKLLASRTAGENVAFAMETSGKTNREIKKTVPKLLEIVGLGDKSRSFPSQLSGGEQQRIAIARALAHEPVLFLADEPTGNLDEDNALEILNILKKINDMGTTIVLATHAKDLVDKMKKRVMLLENGKLTSDVKSGKYKLE